MNSETVDFHPEVIDGGSSLRGNQHYGDRLLLADSTRSTSKHG